ncbi:MAG: hypothetical protein A6D92_00835 [Symbiobacterium thermophilum]|uniref:Uncharacterized protein n=1 Tax=Symbiobacterium thermophilum TaxID=2734 RepID=A0A1Y2T729_SYMTR|nr:MAG: hypothetical protein A6D92_00835 [Symbiobacterium thermophilum]
MADPVAAGDQIALQRRRIVVVVEEHERDRPAEGLEPQQGDVVVFARAPEAQGDLLVGGEGGGDGGEGLRRGAGVLPGQVPEVDPLVRGRQQGRLPGQGVVKVQHQEGSVHGCCHPRLPL